MTDKPRGGSKPCSLRIVRGDRVLTGTSAQLAHISERGGWDAFLQATAIEFVSFYNETARRGHHSTPTLKLITGGRK